MTGFPEHPNVKAIVSEEVDDGDIGEVITAEEAIRDRITHILLIYPVISNSMLQIGIGPSMSPRVWKPIFHEMVEEHQVVVSTRALTAPSGRYQTYTLISLHPEYRDRMMKRLLD